MIGPLHRPASGRPDRPSRPRSSPERRDARNDAGADGVGLAFVALLVTVALILDGTQRTEQLGSTETRAGRVRTIPACTTTQVKLTLGEDAAGAGTRQFVLLFTNEGSSSCRVDGTLRIRGIPAPVAPANVTRGRASKTSLMLRPHSVASALVGTDTVQANGETCVTVATLLVQLPGREQWKRLALRFSPKLGPLTTGTYACVPLSVLRVSAGVVRLGSP